MKYCTGTMEKDEVEAMVEAYGGNFRGRDKGLRWNQRMKSLDGESASVAILESICLRGHP